MRFQFKETVYGMDAAWDWTGPADPDVLQMQDCLRSRMERRRQMNDPWLARAWHDQDVFEQARRADIGLRG